MPCALKPNIAWGTYINITPHLGSVSNGTPDQASQFNICSLIEFWFGYVPCAAPAAQGALPLSSCSALA